MAHGGERVDLRKMRDLYDKARAGRQGKRGEEALSVNRVTARIVEDTHMEVTLGRHTLQVDEPASRGGKDLGPSPLQLFAAGVAT